MLTLNKEDLDKAFRRAVNGYDTWGNCAVAQLDPEAARIICRMGDRAALTATGAVWHAKTRAALEDDRLVELHELGLEFSRAVEEDMGPDEFNPAGLPIERFVRARA